MRLPLVSILKRNYRKFICLFLLGLFGCAQMTSLGLKKHQFGVQPSKIIWLQIAGLEEQHLAMLKFSAPSVEQKTEFENFLCLGKMWNFNLYNLRKKSFNGFKTQVTGSKNIKGKCEDYEQKPIWDYLLKSGYKTGYFESHANKTTSLFSESKCEQKKKYISGVTSFVSSPYLKSKVKSEKFHASEEVAFKGTKTYFDRSCDTKGCFTTLQENVLSTFKRFSKNKNYYLYMLRDYSFENSMRAKKFKSAKRILLEFNSLIKLLKKEVDLSDTLIVLSSTSAVAIDFPRAGRKWKQFETNNKYAPLRNDLLLSPVMASGARAENFCGIYDESELLSRILSSPKQQGLEFIMLNPFNR
jgi:hypothetical protein